MPSDFVVRRAIVGDREAVQRIAAAGMREFGVVPDFGGLDAELAHLGEERVGSVAEFTAVLGNAVCGSVIVSVKGRVGKPSGFYVRNVCRGHGIGRALLHAAVEAAREAGLARLYLATWGRMHAAVRLYESTGWVRGHDLAPTSGADRSYWLDLGEPNSAIPGRGLRALTDHARQVARLREDLT
jgi:GNAT superfamily N-acetyltransferase